MRWDLILSLSLRGNNSTSQDQQVLICNVITFWYERTFWPHNDANFQNEDAKCAYWKPELGENKWKTDGCVRVKDQTGRNRTICECNHLTAFATIDISRNLVRFKKSAQIVILKIERYFTPSSTNFRLGCNFVWEVAVIGLTFQLQNLQFPEITSARFPAILSQKKVETTIWKCLTLSWFS